MQAWIRVRRRCGLAALVLAALFLFAFAFGWLSSPRPGLTQSSNHPGDTVVLQGGRGEVYIAGLPPGWVLGFQESTEIGHHLEWVPDGQPPRDWRDMMAFQLFPKLVDLPPDQFLTRMADHYADSCDQVLATDIEGTPINGYQGALRVLACTRNKVTGLGEVTLFRAVMGEESFYVVQRAWRMDPFAADTIPVSGPQLDDARQVIEYGMACRGQTPDRPCPPGWDEVLATLDSSRPAMIYKASR